MKSAYEIVDTHIHMWDLSEFKLSWLSEPRFAAIGKSSFSLPDYKEMIKDEKLPITSGVYMESEVDPAYAEKEIQFVTSHCAKKNFLGGAVVQINPDSNDFIDLLYRYRSNRYIKGIRKCLYNENTNYILHPSFIRNLRLLGRYPTASQHWSFDICVGPRQMEEVYQMVKQCPNTQFILDHCGNPHQCANETELASWREGIIKCAALDNLVVKVSGMPSMKLSDHETEIKLVFDQFGEDRVLLGGDWPLGGAWPASRENTDKCVPLWMDGVVKIAEQRWSPKQVQKLCSENARRVYRLDSNHLKSHL